jgi:hypothetical protein
MGSLSAALFYSLTRCECSTWVQCRRIESGVAGTRKPRTKVDFIPIGPITPRAEAEERYSS